ncbi:MAG: sulfurtransferase TusA family protein [Alphaproteobacteria bacterium]|nr:sulfurtransferase TusA family protein [Alphaproteobacteria bacterium]
MTRTLDTKGLKCPLPVLRAKKALRDHPPGALLVVEATDAAARRDFEAFCREAGHDFVGVEESAGILTITIRKGA